MLTNWGLQSKDSEQAIITSTCNIPFDPVPSDILQSDIIWNGNLNSTKQYIFEICTTRQIIFRYFNYSRQIRKKFYTSSHLNKVHYMRSNKSPEPRKIWRVYN